ncbi:MAG TPA: hypothetical protein DDX98_02135 [Bacteroidales bacterium]|jgi:hypothetical protein|nr:hypothetical protein [Bacteroidales bacterium]
MKKLLLFLCIILLGFTGLQAQNEDDGYLPETPMYLTANLLIGNPVQEFWATYSKQRLWGFNIDFVFAPVEDAAWWQPGIQFEMYPFGSQKNNWSGLEVETSGAFTKFNIVSRFRALPTHRISPYIELGYGLHLSSTTTKYEIVDEATFWEEVFFDEQDEVETVTAKEFYDGTQNFSVGAGIVFNRLITFQVKYNVTPKFRYVDRDDVNITQTSIDYKTTESKMQMLVVSIGFSLEKMFF